MLKKPLKNSCKKYIKGYKGIKAIIINITSGPFFLIIFNI